MNKIIFVLPMLFSYQCMALTTIYDGSLHGEKGESSRPYLRLNPNHGLQNTFVDDNQDDIPGYPAKSELKPGEFASYQLSTCQKLNPPFFVIGVEPLSLDWLGKHQKHLQKVHAIGFITNIDSPDQLKELEDSVSVNLIPTNVDGLAEIINAPSYPFFTNGCEVWQ